VCIPVALSGCAGAVASVLLGELIFDHRSDLGWQRLGKLQADDLFPAGELFVYVSKKFGKKGIAPLIVHLEDPRQGEVSLIADSEIDCAGGNLQISGIVTRAEKWALGTTRTQRFFYPPRSIKPTSGALLEAVKRFCALEA
jgi:hypothetical protein